MLSSPNQESHTLTPKHYRLYPAPRCASGPGERRSVVFVEEPDYNLSPSGLLRDNVISKELKFPSGGKQHEPKSDSKWLRSPKPLQRSGQNGHGDVRLL